MASTISSRSARGAISEKVSKSSTTAEVLSPRSCVLVIPGTPAYSLSPNSRTHWAVKQRETRHARSLVMAVLSFRRDISRFTGPVQVAWTIYLPKGGKRRDTDNILPCCKPYLDQIVFAGIIPDDSPKYIPETPTVEQITWGEHRGEPHIDVQITEAVQPRQEGR
jgi:Holliday junction resolvase RusA-like endonuclease